MGSNLQMVMRSFGVVFLALGLVASIIECLALRAGEGHPAAMTLAVGSLVAGAVLFGVGTAMNRRAG